MHFYMYMYQTKQWKHHMKKQFYCFRSNRITIKHNCKACQVALPYSELSLVVSYEEKNSMTAWRNWTIKTNCVCRLKAC